MSEGLSSSRVIILPTQEELDEFKSALFDKLMVNKGQMDKTTEDWFDSEFNHIYVTYAYPDVTKVN